MAIIVRPGVALEEVALALPDPGMPLEAVRYPVTPIGMDYVLVDFDVPEIDAAVYELRDDGRVRATLVLTIEDLRSRPAVSIWAMMGCAGSGRTRLGQQLSDFGQGACLRGPRGWRSR
jgi:DMSO/TMAO reductase YedYZ molybdopterin-dependent catalytic subunit